MMKMKTFILLVLVCLLLTPLAPAQNDTKTDFWSQQSLAETSGTITQLTIFPQVDTVGVKTVYRVEFSLNGDTLQPEATVRLYFPTGFGLTEIDSVLYSDDDPGNVEYQIGDLFHEGQELRVEFAAGGQAPMIGSKITLKLFGVRNATATRSYQIALAVVSLTNELIAAPTWSASFSLRADKLASLSLYPEGIQQVRAGAILQYSVVTQDQFGNAIFVQPINWSVIGVPSPTGTIAGGTFQAKHTGASKIVASYQWFADTSNLVYVLPGAFAHFVMSGAPETVVAGDSWRNGIDDVVVTAYDLFENVSYDFDGAVYFSSSDAQAVVPYAKTAPYSFVAADQGRHTFPGSGFRLFTAGRQSLELLTGDTVMQTINGITVLPASVESYQMSAPNTVMAGQAFVLSVSHAADHWNNAITGRVDLRLASGSGIAPSGALPSLSSFFAENGSGSGSVLLVRAGTDILKVDLGGVVRNHPILVVADSLAGFESAHFVMSGAPESVVAGDSWRNGVDDIVVTAYDLFENVRYEYNGAVYFRSSDALAMIPYTKSAPYSFVAADQGRHTFPGSGFGLFTAGRQSLELLRGDTVMQTISGITVLPALVESYQLSAPDTVMAGHAFVLSVSHAADRWNNAVSGRVDLRLASGSGVAPSGALPSLSSFFAASGSGSGSVLLVRAGTDILKVDLEGVVTNHPISVVADSLARFEFALDAVQVPGRPFTGNAELGAFDRFDNTCDWFDAALDPVTINCSGPGSVLNGLVDTPGAFEDGVCDLKRIGTGYSGNDLYVTFTATSQTGKKGTSPSVGFSQLKITDGSLDETTKYIGEQYTFRLTISDFGNQPAVIDAIRLYMGNAMAVLPSVDRVFPDTIMPVSNRTYTFRGDVPNRPGEPVSFAAAFSGRIGSATVSDSVGNLGDLTILPLEGVDVAASSLSPLQVTRGKAYSFSLRVVNNSTIDLHLTTATKLALSQVAEYPLENPIVVLARGGVTELKFLKADIPLQSPDLISDMSVHLVGTLGSVAFDRSFEVTPPVVTQSKPSLSYQPASLSPTTMFRGRDVTFTLDVMNAGTATLSAGSASVSLSVFAAGRQMSATADDGQMLFPNGATNLTFKPLFVPVDFPAALDSLVVEISGAANGYDEAFKIRIPGSSVTVPAGAAVQLISTNLLARNAPHVNIGQHFEIAATIRNQGDEPLQQIVVKMISDGASIFTDSTLIDLLPVAAESTITYAVTAALIPSSSELFSARVTRATGVNSGLAAQVLTPLAGTQAVVIQTPANLRLISSIASPAEAQDGVVEPSSVFSLSASVLNNGQSTVGEGEVTLRQLEGTFVATSEPTQVFAIGQDVEWNLTAPATNDTGRFEIAITQSPEDDNTGIAAKAIDRADTIVIISTEEQVALGVDFTSLSPTLLAAGGTYEMLRFSFDIVGKPKEPYLKYVDLALHDRAGNEVDPSVLIAATSLRYNNNSDITGITSGDRVRFNLGGNAGLPQVAVLSITLRSDPTLLDAVLYLDSNSFAAEYISPAGAKPVPITARFASRLIIKQDLTLVPVALEQSFFSYPNPFSPLTEQATIVYSSSVTKPATLKIYTLTGDEVFSRTLPVPVSTNEPKKVIWEGKNADGTIVLNGIYIAVLTVEGMPEVRTKIAVVK